MKRPSYTVRVIWRLTALCMQPIIQFSRGPYIVAVHPSLPVKNIKELIALAKAQPNTINYASSGTGANVHLVTEMFTSMTGTKMVHIPYKGTGPGVVDTIAGQTSLVFGSMPVAFAVT